MLGNGRGKPLGCDAVPVRNAFRTVATARRVACGAWLACAGLSGANAAAPALDGATAAASSAATAGPATATVPPQAGASGTAQDWRAREGLYFKRNWGVEIIGMRVTSSGYMLSFRYRVLDPLLARPLNDEKSKAYVIDEATGIRLAVPAMENIGELRQTAAAKADRNYFIIFGNPLRLVKPGARVSVVVGRFHVSGLVVE